MIRVVHRSPGSVSLQKDVHHSLVSCAALCEKIAAQYSATDQAEDQYQLILTCLDCANACRQMAMMYLRRASVVQSLAKSCIHVCERCIQQVACQRTAKPSVEKACLGVIADCLGIVNATKNDKVSFGHEYASVFYGIDMSRSAGA